MKTEKRKGWRKLKRTLFVIGVVLALFCMYVEIINRNSVNMSYRQKILKAVYPALMWFNKITGKKTNVKSNEQKQPVQSFYHLSIQLNDGSALDMESLKGKKVLLVNTASDCGYTGQYADLQKIYEANKDHLVVIGFPANDFKEQEKGSDEEIAAFCQRNYGVTFPLAKKSVVIKGGEQNTVFRWLTDKSLNGWNEQEPTWNFSKYLVNEEGVLTHYFDPAVSPSGKEITEAIANN